MVKELRPGGEGTADLEPPAATTARLDRAPCGGDHVLHDREPEPGTARGTRAVGSVETFEEARQVGLIHAGAVVHDAEHDAVTVAGHRQRRVGSRPRVADRV